MLSKTLCNRGQFAPGQTRQRQQAERQALLIQGNTSNGFVTGGHPAFKLKGDGLRVCQQVAQELKTVLSMLACSAKPRSKQKASIICRAALSRLGKARG